MKKIAARATMMNTMMVVTVVSFLVGQVTFLTSPITSRTYWAGLIVAIGLNCFLLRLNRAEARSLISAHPRPKSAGPGKRGPPAAWLAGVEGLEPPRSEGHTAELPSLMTTQHSGLCLT